MGQFSWLDCRDRSQIKDDKRVDVYVLIPKEFGGGHILEECYDGYGNFGGQDIYDLVAVWNKGMIPEILRRNKAGHWKCSISEKEAEQMMNYHDGKECTMPLRYIGIKMACYDEDNFALEYPIKITHYKYVVYEQCMASEGDPNQGW